MNSVRFFSGQLVEADDLNNAQLYKEQAILASNSDIRAVGVVDIDGEKYTILTTDSTNKMINVSGFTAYDEYGNRIDIPKSYDSGNIVPTIINLKLSEEIEEDAEGHILNPDIKLSTDGFNFPFGKQFIIIVRKNSVLDSPSRKHISDGTSTKVTVRDEYEFFARFGNSTKQGDVLLASATVGDENKVTLDESVRQISYIRQGSIAATYTPDTHTKNYGESGYVTLKDHVNALGTGTVTDNNPHGISAADLGIEVDSIIEHQAKSHCDGIRTDDLGSITSALYPDVIVQTDASSDKVIIYPLSESLNELLVANGLAFKPESIRTRVTFSLENKEVGFYVVVFDTIRTELDLRGPFATETNEDYIQLINNRAYFKVCKFKLGNVSYDLDNDGTADHTGIDIIPGSFKDLRIFNHTSVDTIRPDQTFAISQFAPIKNDIAHIHCARIINSLTSSAYAVGGKNLGLKIDGGDGLGGKTVTVSLTGPSLISSDSVVDQIQNALYDSSSNDIIGYARVTDDGHISISAPIKIEIVPQASTNSDAAPILGFSSMESDESDLVKELIYTGDRTGIILYTYNDEDDVTQIDYLLGGGVKRTNKFIYKNGIIVTVTEEVSDL